MRDRRERLEHRLQKRHSRKNFLEIIGKAQLFRK
jgi:transposase